MKSSEEHEEQEEIGYIEALKILSPKQIKVLEHVAKGMTNKEIGQKLGIAESTVKTHRRNICMKLNLKGPHALVRWIARSNGQVQ